MADQYFGADARWYERNIPFLEIDDPEIQQIYFYRWKLFRSHIREIGAEGTTVVEFLPNVPWARQPDTDLNDSAAFHLMEGRWLRSPAVVNSLIGHLYTGGGDDRHFSEWIAAATEQTTWVTGDPAPALKHLDTMQHIFNLWDDHLDRQRNLYWIEPLLDATEYTIASIDASGAGFQEHASPDQNQNGFTGGFAFRPSINSYQYANAMAISRLARAAGQPQVADDYERRAEAIRGAVLSELWNPGMQHFVDRYQRSTKYVAAGDFIRGRELVGFVPWMFELPPQAQASDSGSYASAWRHALASSELGGPFGLRTVEPSYPRFMTQYRYDFETGRRECQWNGPSWPFQTSQALTGLANLLDDYPRAAASDGIAKADYLRLLRQYTHQHLLADGQPDLQEDYDPETGTPIVGLPRSHHYSHSTDIDLVLSGLIGLRPRPDDVLELNPLVPPEGSSRPIHYFAVNQLAYHGHRIALFYDADGSRYHLGRGLSIFVDGRRRSGPSPLGHLLIPLPPGRRSETAMSPEDLAVNVGVPDGPKGSASSSDSPEGIAQAIDGRMWFFPEIVNGWSPSTEDANPWYMVEFPRPRTVASVELDFFAGPGFAAPAKYKVQARTDEGWSDVQGARRDPAVPLAGGANRIEFSPQQARAIRVLLQPASEVRLRLIELKAYGPQKKDR